VGKTLAILITSLAISGFSVLTPRAQIENARITLLDRSGQSVTHITDGNTLRLEITFPQSSSSDQTIAFTLDNDNGTVGTCIIAAGKDGCQTDPFPALGWYWGAEGSPQPTRLLYAKDAGNNLLAESARITVAARPVVLVHGFISNWETWKPYLGSDGFLGRIGLRGYAIGDGQVPGVLNTGRITNPTDRTNTIQQNAQILGEYINGVKKQTGAEMVDLVVHSMGGMISRYYIDRTMQERDVAQLIMLGSPMGGTDCSVLPASLGFYLPATLEIRSSYMLGIFNRQITHRHGIQFYDLAGTAILEAYQSPCTGVPSDTVVSFGSVNAIPLESRKFNAIHSDLTISPLVFEEFVRPLLQKPAGAFTPAADPILPSTASAPLQFTRVYNGHVDAGGSTELTINIEADVSVASFAMYDPTRSVTVSVRGASGNVIDLDPVKNGFRRIDDPSSMLYLGYGFSNPKPGPWKVTVLATDSTPASGADFAISVYFVGGAALQADSNTLIPALGQPVQFTASLALGGEPLPITSGQVLIRHPDGKVETLDMGAAIQVSATWEPQKPGIYGVDIEVSGQAPDGSPVLRTSFLTLETQPNPTREQVTRNLLAVIGGVLLALVLVIYLIVRLVRRLFRQKR